MFGILGVPGVLEQLQVHRWTIKALHSGYLQRLGRVVSLCDLFVLDLNHSNQWNTLLSAGGEIFRLTHPHGSCSEMVYRVTGGTYTTFYDLVVTFINHFQLPIHYDVGTKLLSTFQQDKATHISDHIQEWCRQKRLIKAFIPPEFLLEWFLKSLLPYIAKDVSTSGVQIEDQTIFRAQKLDLIYSVWAPL